MPIIDSSIYKTMTFDSFENLGQQIWQPSNMSHFFHCDSAGNAVEIIFLKFRSTLPLHLGTTRTGSGYKAGLLHLMAGVRVSLQVFVVNSLSYGWAGQLEPVDEHHEEVQVHCGSRETHEHWKVTGIREIWEAAHKFWVHWRCLIVQRRKAKRDAFLGCPIPEWGNPNLGAQDLNDFLTSYVCLAWFDAFIPSCRHVQEYPADQEYPAEQEARPNTFSGFSRV